MRISLSIVVLLCCTHVLCGQDIPREIVLLRNGGFVHGKVMDSTSAVTRIYVYSTGIIQVGTAEVAGAYKLPEQFREEIRKDLLSPFAAGVSSLILSGGGQLYVGEYSEAALHIALQACTGALLFVGVNSQNDGLAYLGGGMMALLKVLSMFDAGHTAVQINQLRINRAIVDHVQGRDAPPLELSYEIVPIDNGAAAGVQIRF